MGAAVDELRQTLRVESHDEIPAVGDGGHSGPTGEGSPLSQESNVAGDVGFLVRYAVIRKPILGLFAVGSSRRGVDDECCHSRLRGLRAWWRNMFLNGVASAAI